MLLLLPGLMGSSLSLQLKVLRMQQYLQCLLLVVVVQWHLVVDMVDVLQLLVQPSAHVAAGLVDQFACVQSLSGYICPTLRAGDRVPSLSFSMAVDQAHCVYDGAIRHACLEDDADDD